MRVGGAVGGGGGGEVEVGTVDGLRDHAEPTAPAALARTAALWLHIRTMLRTLFTRTYVCMSR